MKKIGIITITDNNNYGNRLQNFALTYFIRNLGLKVYTLWPYSEFTVFSFYKVYLKKILYSKLSQIQKRKSNFVCFTKKKLNLKFSYFKINSFNDFDKILIGSDQILNFNWNIVIERLEKIKYVYKEKISTYAASFGVSEIPDEHKSDYINILNNIKYISVREDRGKELVKEITGRDDAVVLVDPTMLLTVEEWDRVSKKPKMLKNDKYILNYFLGELSKERKEEIERIAKENDCEIINILDKNSPFYVCGPSEFLYLEKHAFLICTDSFHSSVFAILYDRPFIVFDREDKEENMGSRLDTLINKFKLKNRRYNGKNITKENLEHDYTEAYKILEKERKKSEDFLKKALDIKD